jgi:hypothetical protein
MPSQRPRHGSTEERATPSTDHRFDRPEDFPPDVAELGGLRPADADSVPDQSEVDDTGEMTDTRVYMGELEARPPDSDQPDLDERESMTMTEPRSGETDDPSEASDEGLAWIPPTDPPTTTGRGFDPDIAAGFGSSAIDEPYDADHHASGLAAADERTARVVEALQADAATAGLAGGLAVSSDGGRVVVEGTVEDIADEDAVLEVAQRASGVAEVVGRLRIAALETNQDERAGTPGENGGGR